MEKYQPEVPFEINDEYYIYGRKAGLVYVPNEDMELPDQTEPVYDEKGKVIGRRQRTLIVAIR